ncbi:MAG: 3-dehydroquinate synthase [Pseudomonadota bacterium]
MQTVRVDLAERAYNIHVGDGLLAGAGERIASLRPGARAAIVTDETVDAVHGDALRKSLDDAGVGHATITVAAGEKSKSFDHLAEVVDGLLGAEIERGDVLLAFGGGVVGDLAGFAAGITRRGMDFVQIPTSLLAQVDSSVGGKTGINTPRGKNLVGLFNQPQMVLADTALIDTLSERERRAGYAEIIKYGAIDRPAFFAWLEDNHDAVINGGAGRQHAVVTACEAKAAVVKADELEGGQRALLILGHTFGHALEAAVGYDAERLVHGEGVAIGMVMAHDFSARMNLCSPDDGGRLRRHLEAVGLPTSVSQIPGANAFTAGRLMEAIGQDKKVKRGALTFILTRGIGQAFVADDVPSSEVRAFLDQQLANAA